MMPVYRFRSLFNPCSYRRMTDDSSLQALVHVSFDQLFLLAVPVDEQTKVLPLIVKYVKEFAPVPSTMSSDVCKIV
jgi:hypothetical protein